MSDPNGPSQQGWPQVVQIRGRSGDAEVLRSSVFAHTVTELCAAHNLRCSVRLNPSSRAFAQANPLTRRILVSRAAIAGPDDEQAWSAAHEVGHLMAARDQGLWRYMASGFFFWLLIGAAASSAGPMLVVTALRPVLPEVLFLRLAVVLIAMVAGVVVLCGCLHVALLRLGSHQRPQEDEADAFAKGQGYPVTEAIATMLDLDERRSDGRLPSPRWRQYPRHREPYDRINDAD